MKTTITGKDTCPSCHEEVEMSTSIDSDAVPKPGDISLCAYCGSVNMFSDDMALIELPKVLFDTFDEETQNMILVAQQVIRENVLKNKRK